VDKDLDTNAVAFPRLRRAAGRQITASIRIAADDSRYWAAFAGLMETPFQHAALVWGVVPLYFGRRLNAAFIN